MLYKYFKTFIMTTIQTYNDIILKNAD